MRFLSRQLTADRIDDLVRSVMDKSRAGKASGVLRAIRPLVDAQGKQLPAARALSRLLARGAIDPERARRIAESILACHGEEPAIVGHLGQACEYLFEPRALNAPPVDEPFVVSLGERLLAMRETPGAADAARIEVLGGLGTIARLLGRSWDAVAESCYRELVERRPQHWQSHYDLGLFYKTRGRFEEGLAANQAALGLGGEGDEALLWNLGICATGAHRGGPALEAWRALGHDVRLGRFDLPEGDFAPVKVHLVARPLAARGGPDVPDEPGSEEAVWVERLSPCHGIVRSALFEDLAIDYGDVVLFDGAPVTRHRYGVELVPVFPQIVTLERPGYRIYRFAATQREEHQIAGLSDALPADAVFYAHTEQVVRLCRGCWESPDADHGDHVPLVHPLVTGKLCVPPDLGAAETLAAVDRAVAGSEGAAVFAPDLAEAAGDRARAQAERRRFEMLDM